MYALLDGNNFYCSIESAFRPSLRNVPLVVLSNNDGCAIARNELAKSLGIKMGAPYFQIRHLEHQAGLVALSANFSLYGDMSERMMSLAAGFGPRQWVYSVDEAFFGDLQGVPRLTDRAWTIRSRIQRGIGISCGVGIAPTLTLAKLANHVAKAAERKPGSYPPEYMQVCNLAELSTSQLDDVLKRTIVGDVWGIGRKLSVQLAEANVCTALQLRDMDTATVRARWGIVLEKTVRELRGTACFTFEDAPAPKQVIACTRSFGRPVTEFDDLAQAVSAFASRAAEKLRRQKSFAGQLQVFAHTSPFRDTPRFSRSAIVPLPEATADTQILVGAAITGLRRIYEPGFELSKAGVLLLDLYGQQYGQGSLALEEPVRDRSALQSTMDNLNQRYGRGTVQVASSGAQAEGGAWQMKQERRTPLYTTRFEDMLSIS